MIQVAYPPPNFKLKKKGDKRFIFDAIRKRWLSLTPEEWVRQNFIQYLLQVKRYPKEAIALEKEILVNGLSRRFDAVIYNNDHQPWMMIECKAPEIALTENVLQQLLRYHIAIPVQWMVITNGKHTLGWTKTGESLEAIDSLPQWR